MGAAGRADAERARTPRDTAHAQSSKHAAVTPFAAALAARAAPLALLEKRTDHPDPARSGTIQRAGEQASRLACGSHSDRGQAIPAANGPGQWRHCA